MALKYFVLLACAGSVAFAQRQGKARTDSLFDLTFDIGGFENKETTTPIPILRYIDTQNNDGSYTYGYESGDGTYKIETRYATGEVKGKYGYYDDSGVFREVEYGADPKLGFMPTGDGLAAPVAPAAAPRPAEPAPNPAPRIAAPTPRPQKDRRVVLRRRPRPQPVAERRIQEEEDFSDEPSESRFRNFRIAHPEHRRRNKQPDHPRITVVRKPAATTPAPRRPRPTPRPAPRPTAAPAPIREQPRFIPQQQAAPAVRSQQNVFQQNVFRPQPDPNAFFGHPAKNIDLNDGSYTITYG